MVTRKAPAPTIARARRDLKAAAQEVKEAVVHKVEVMAERLGGKLQAARAKVGNAQPPPPPPPTHPLPPPPGGMPTVNPHPPPPVESPEAR